MTDDGEFTARASFAPEPTAPSRARVFTRDTLRSWGLPPEQVDDAVLLVSELVANGVQHAGTPLEVSCQLNPAGASAGPSPAGSVLAGLEVRVTDKHPRRTIPDAPAPFGDADSERGRGLLLPMALAAAWGITYTAGAKTVWFTLPVAVARDANGLAPGNRPRAAQGNVEVARGELPQRDLGNLGFEELVRRTVESARDAVGADAAYALIADEEGELRVRGVVGIAVPEALTIPPGKIVLSGNGDDRSAGSQLSVPFTVDGRVTGVLGVGAAADEAFGSDDSARLQRVADRVAMSLERLRLSELERVRRGRVAFLAEASELLSSTLDQRQAIALTAQLMVPRLAAWCAVFIAASAGTGGSGDPGGSGSGPSGELAGELKAQYVWHEDESRIDVLAELLDEIAPPSLGKATAGQASSWSLAVPPGAGPEMTRMASDAAWCFPLTARGRGLGAVVIGRPRGDRRWPDPAPRESLELAEDLTRRAALALDNARLYERQRTTSQALQHSLLPPELPLIPGVELAAEYEAAGEANDVGGDFYDVFPVMPDADGAGLAGGTGAAGVRRWRFAIGDVCGTGPEAAAVTGLARHTLRILATEGHGITEVVSRLNRLILSEGTRGRFITLLHGEIRVPASATPGGDPQAPAPRATASGAVEMSLVCAGHPLPLLLRAGDGGPGGPGAIPAPAARPQTLLGVVDAVTYEADEILLHPGDVLLCVTDGVAERRDDFGRMLDDDDGLARMLAGCRDLSACAVGSRIRRAVSEFGTEPSFDDMAILVLRAE